MQKNLVIVESPAKAKTIEKFLGKDYKVLSSYGHIRDLKKKEFSINTDTFEPDYEIPAEKKKLVSELKQEAKKADMVWLASDEDREGEAISWHLYEVLGLNPEHTKRIVFHEITKNAILRAIEHPRDIDINLVNAQQARRVLDRIVGFKLSPVLWRKVKPALSAGRVQSVAVRLIVEREREIQAFHSEASFRVTAVFSTTDADRRPAEIRAELNTRFKTEDEAKAFLEKCRHTEFTVQDITTRPMKKSPAPPFTTSTLQQEAARKLGFTVAQTMMVAQRLYESGFITYMRTDSVNLSSLAIGTSREAITQLMGERYVQTRQFTTKSKGAQEAHEAIRPTYMEHQTIEADSAERRLYDLIWKRTIASQMADAELEKTTATIALTGMSETFVATGEVVTFDGFLRVYRESLDDEETEDESRLLPPLKKGQKLDCGRIVAQERFTQHPPRYTEASLVRKLEELGIGRPSTYAPTISTIQQRGYVEKGDKPGEERTYKVLTLSGGRLTTATRSETAGSEKGKLLPTDVGTVVNDFLLQYFPGIMDYNFTASVEKEFDEVAEGDKQWTTLIRQFYGEFEPMVEQTLAVKTEHKVGERELGTDPVSGRPVFVKIGRFGPVVQIGSADDEEKPRFAQINKGQSIETITLDEALELFKLPRTLDDYEGKPVIIGTGKFGPYVRHDGKFISLPKGADPMTFSYDEAVELILAKRAAEAQKHIKRFDEEPELEILNGRYGPYITYKGNNYRLPKTLKVEPKDLELADCLAIIKEQDEKPASTKGRRFAKRK
ncbi:MULTISPECIES: type I DNA topoisomerase [Mediterranea]|uniref:type I DNA topoisomerase n=1 Tax=Mediterranea TaxID=1926659 RepID=UPI002013262D|nr:MULTISPECIES: type I DNA topoisomerase [Mediterranea]MCL1608860.1 type I DNA topoisomerase [Mediterranea sp. ET5]MDM8123433.1 type I DNA topoisomerase [Mediterranea massiliensis]MDM8197584.1 type I DNA topoisomerase [Mediterranea massiliensis]